MFEARSSSRDLWYKTTILQSGDELFSLTRDSERASQKVMRHGN